MSKKGIIILIISIIVAVIILPVLILVAILVFGLGTYTFNQSKEIVSDNIDSQISLSQQEISAFNSRFESYESTDASGATIKTLIQSVKASNSSYNDSDRMISITFDGTDYEEDEISEITSLVDSSSTYTVFVNKNFSGLINNIEIYNNSAEHYDETNDYYYED